MPDSDVLRLIDANANRAREALRVVEDYCRFALDDADAALTAKRARHALRDALKCTDDTARLAARDAHNDVGREQKTPQELQRESPEDVARAAFARLTEATRSLSEFGKLVAPSLAAGVESIRYTAYELEQRVALRGDARRRFRACRLYVIVTAALCRLDWRETARRAIRGGASCVQLREKSLSDLDLLQRARDLRQITRAAGALLIINDRADIARLADADGVHVGQEDLPVAQARRIGGGRLLVGKSSHTVEQFDAAVAESPDYVAIGPMFASATKPQPEIAGIDALAEVAGRSTLPIVAIGGIDGSNLARVRRGGAACICVCSAVISSTDPEAAARELLAQFSEAT
ncbi:MAG: thiamine phosphate synthase [Phycisphaerae bacterium]